MVQDFFHQQYPQPKNAKPKTFGVSRARNEGINNYIDHDMIKQIKIWFSLFHLKTLFGYFSKHLAHASWELEQKAYFVLQWAYQISYRAVTFGTSTPWNRLISVWNSQEWLLLVHTWRVLNLANLLELSGTWHGIFTEVTLLIICKLDEFHNIPISGNPQMLGAWISYFTRDPPNPSELKLLGECL